jgi:hypothetical protein
MNKIVKDEWNVTVNEIIEKHLNEKKPILLDYIKREITVGNEGYHTNFEALNFMLKKFRERQINIEWYRKYNIWFKLPIENGDALYYESLIFALDEKCDEIMEIVTKVRLCYIKTSVYELTDDYEQAFKKLAKVGHTTIICDSISQNKIVFITDED